jgi:hypothetical protein
MANLVLGLDRLRCYDVLLIAFVMLAIDIAVALWNRRGTQLSPEEVVLLKQYNDQVRVVNKLNSVETFVEQSKAIRKMNNIKKQMQELAGVVGLYRVVLLWRLTRWFWQQWSACKRRRRPSFRSGSTNFERCGEEGKERRSAIDTNSGVVVV